MKTSSNVVSFTRTFNASDVIEVTGGAPKDSLNYIKTEKSTLINKILQSSRGSLNAGIAFGHEENKSASETFNPNIDFGKQFEVNGTYVLEKAYCKQKRKRSLVFADLASSSVQKSSLKATIDLST